MKLKVFTLQLDAESGGFDDSALQSFLAERDAIAVDEHFFVHDGVPRWALLVHHREAAADKRRRGSEPRESDWRSDLSSAEADLFTALRSWRNSRARRDGRPAFVLFTNRQLAEIAKVAPRTLTELATVQGVGEARVRDYGQSVLAIVRESFGVGGDSTPTAGPQTRGTDARAPEDEAPPTPAKGRS